MIHNSENINSFLKRKYLILKNTIKFFETLEWCTPKLNCESETDMFVCVLTVLEKIEERQQQKITLLRLFSVLFRLKFHASMNFSCHIFCGTSHTK